MKKREDMLVQYVEDVKGGSSSIEDCLNRYPSVREQLEPLLKIAVEIQKRRGNRVEQIRGHTCPVY